MPKYKDIMKEIEEENLAEWAHSVAINLEEPTHPYEARSKPRVKVPRPKPKKRK